MPADGTAYRRDPTGWIFGRKMWSALPSCLLCASPIVEVGMDGREPTRRELNDEQEWWKASDDSAKKHVLVPSAEVEKTAFHKHPYIWRALYRGILMDSNQQHRLTGITVFDGDWGADKFPRSPHQARIGGELDGIFMPKYAANLLEDLGAARVTSSKGLEPYWPPEERHGYLVHAHCWALFGQVIEGGVSQIEANLDVLVQAAKLFWQKDKLRDTPEFRARWYTGPSPGVFDGEMSEKGLRIMRADGQNPLFVPKLEEAIHRNRIQGKVHLHVGFDGFPLDLAIQIIDAVCPAEYTAIEVQNARNLLAAFQWTLPDGYWQNRCDSSLVFEVKKLEKTKTRVDWQALGLDVMSLLVEDEFTNGLRNRECILLYMDHIKRRFIELL